MVEGMEAPRTVLGVLLAGTVAGWTAWRVARGDFDGREHLPLDLCNLSALLSLACALTDAPLLAVWMVCFAAPGGVVSMLAPDLEERHPRSTRAKFWIVHPGLVVFGLLTALGEPPPDGGWMLARLWLLLAAYAAAVAVVDWRVGANYLFLRHKPSTPSPLDRMGPRPFYLFPLTAVIMATMILVFLGWWCMWR